MMHRESSEDTSYKLRTVAGVRLWLSLDATARIQTSNSQDEFSS